MADLNCPLPLDCSESYGTLVIATVPLQGPAWCAPDLSPLLESPAFRGENPTIERLAGRSARPIIDDETEYSIRLVFSGATDQAGVPHASGPAGLLENRRVFEDTYIRPIREGSATLAAELTVPDGGEGDTYEFGIQPLRLTFELQPRSYALGVLRVRVPVPFILTMGE